MVAEIRLSQVDSCRDGALGVGGGFKVRLACSTRRSFSPATARRSNALARRAQCIDTKCQNWEKGLVDGFTRQIKTTHANVPSDPHQK
jgi:hypothetical protein